MEEAELFIQLPVNLLMYLLRHLSNLICFSLFG